MEIHPMSYSRLKDFAVSPGYFKHRLTVPFEPSPAMLLGQAVEAFVQGGEERFEERFCIKPSDEDLFASGVRRWYQANEGKEAVCRPQGLDMRTKAGREWKADLDARGAVIRPSDSDILAEAKAAWRERMGERATVGPEAQDIAMSILCYEPAMGLLVGADHQVELAGNREGCPLKGFADSVQLGSCSIIDLKTSKDASPEGFAKQAHSLRYSWQALFYLHMMGQRLPDVDWRFFWIVAETSAPYRVEVYEPSEAWLALAAEQVDPLLRSYLQFCATDFWPVSSGQVHTLNPPKWAWKEEG